MEFVAPFLQRFGGKVFVYKWLTVKDKIMQYYSDRDQYPDVQVEEFSLSNIVQSILQEEKKVVFLLTASMAYAFGPSPSQVAAGTKQGAGWGLSLIGRLVPSTTAGWGVTAVFAAFAFLGIGAAISLRKPPGDDGTGEPPPPLPVPAEPPFVPGLTDGDGAQGDAAPAVT